MAERRDCDVVDDEMARILRGMTGAERLKIANDMFVSARRMLASHLTAEHPDWDQERIERETPRRRWRSTRSGKARSGGSGTTRPSPSPSPRGCPGPE